MKINHYVGALVFLAACNNQDHSGQTTMVAKYQPLEFKAMEVPAGAGSFYPRLAKSPDEQTLSLSWYRKKEADTQLFVANHEAGSWSDPELVVEDDNLFVNWADFPNLTHYGKDGKAISYLHKNGDGLYAYDVQVKLYDPDKGSWKQALVPHSDGTQTEHGFVSMAPMQNNTLGVIWLDGRKYEHAEQDHENMGDAEMTLRFARIGKEASVIEEQELDGRTCDCCQTALAAGASGLIAVYRDRTEDEVRDIAYVRYENGAWTSPKRLYADEWTIKGCPVNGPAIAAEKEEVVVAWYTAAGNNNTVKLIRSVDEGKTWESPVVIDDQKPMGRVAVCLLPDKSAVVSWMAEDAMLKVKRISARGEMLGMSTVAKVEGSRSSGFPQLVNSRNTLYLAWTENGEQKEVKVAMASLK